MTCYYYVPLKRSCLLTRSPIRVILLRMSADEFTRLFTYMEERFNRIDKALEKKAEKLDVERILNAVDALAKRQEINDEERLVMGHQLERLNTWVHQLAAKIGVELSV